MNRNDPQLIKRIGDYKALNPNFKLLFHDTNHRSVTQPLEIQRFDLSNYDGVLAFGDVIKNLYQKNSLVRNAWTWHEAADTDVFYPRPKSTMEGDLVWVGNWGDDERSDEIREFIIEPVKALNLKAVFYGVGYPSNALEWLKDANIEYRGWIPNFKVPEVFLTFPHDRACTPTPIPAKPARYTYHTHL
jgi:spore maturation protein CgeB